MSVMRAGVAPLLSLSLVCGAFGHAQAQQTPPARRRRACHPP